MNTPRARGSGEFPMFPYEQEPRSEASWQEEVDAFKRSFAALDKENGFLEDRIAELEAENATLKDLLHTANAAERDAEAETIKVEAERDRLRAAMREIHENLMSLEDGGFAPTARLAWREIVEDTRAALSPAPAIETSADTGERSRRKFQAEHQAAPATEGGEQT